MDKLAILLPEFKDANTTKAFVRTIMLGENKNDEGLSFPNPSISITNNETYLDAHMLIKVGSIVNGVENN